MRLADGPPGPKGIFSLIMTPDMPGNYFYNYFYFVFIFWFSIGQG